MKRIVEVLALTFLFILVCPQKIRAFEEPVAGINVSLDVVKEKPIETAAAFYSAIYRVDCNLVLAVIDSESGGEIQSFNINDNGSHDSGLMQVNSCNHAWLSEELGITDFYDTRQNIQAGTYILSLLTAKYEDYHRVLMSYNMGEYRTGQLWKQGIYSSGYSRKVMETYWNLRKGEGR